MTKAPEDMCIVVPAVDQQTGGKYPLNVLHKVDAYLRTVAPTNSKALLALNSPTDEEKEEVQKLQHKKKKL